MRRFPLTLLALSLAPLVACRGPAAVASTAIGHAVVFELNEPSAVAELHTALEELLAATPGLVEARVGPRADVAVREGLTDTSFDLLMWTHFADAEALLAYIESPRHVALVERFKPLLRRVRVFDIATGRGAQGVR